MPKTTFKRKLYLTVAASSLIFRNWSIRKKLHIGFTSLIGVLALNVILTSYEISRLKEYQLKLSYLVYLDLIGVVTGCLFIWIVSQSVLRPIKKIIHQLETQSTLENLQLYSNDEIGQLARAVSSIKRSNSLFDEDKSAKNVLLETILSHSTEGIFIFDQRGALTNYSRGFESMTGYSHLEKNNSLVSSTLLGLELEKVFSHLEQEESDNLFYEQKVNCKNEKSQINSLNCTVYKVKGFDEVLFIGVLKQLPKKNFFHSFIDNTFSFRKK